MSAAKAPKSEMKAENIPFDRIFWDHERNVRMASNLDVTPIKNFDPNRHRPGLYESIFFDGLKLPVTVNELSQEQIESVRDKAAAKGIKDPLYRGIAGHRRSLVIAQIRTQFPDKFVRVPAVVYHHLTDMEEINLMMDHEHVRGLNDFEKYLSIKTLLLSGLSEEAVARKMNLTRGVVQRRGWIAKLPPQVEENYRARYEPVDEANPRTVVNFTDNDLRDLAKAATADRTAGIELTDPASQTMQMWEELASKGRAKPKEPKALNRNEMKERLQLVHDPIIKAVIQICAGDLPGTKLAEVLEEMKALREKAAGGGEGGSPARRKSG